MPPLGSLEVRHFGADSASRCTAGFDAPHADIAAPRDTYPPLLPIAEGSWNSLSGVRHLPFDHGDYSSETRHGMGRKSGWNRSCLRLLLPTSGASGCDLGSANWRSGISSVPPHLQRGTGQFVVRLDI